MGPKAVSPLFSVAIGVFLLGHSAFIQHTSVQQGKWKHPLELHPLLFVISMWGGGEGDQANGLTSLPNDPVIRIEADVEHTASTTAKPWFVGFWSTTMQGSRISFLQTGLLVSHMSNFSGQNNF